MTIDPIQNQAIPVNAHRVAPAGRQGGTGGERLQEIGGTRTDSPVQSHSTWSELQKVNDSNNEAAQKDRTVENMLRNAEEYVDRMSAQLERIIKNFPPFPPGDEERINLLRGYAGFRKLIDQLTIPPQENSAAAETSRILSLSEPVAGADGAGERTLGKLPG